MLALSEDPGRDPAQADGVVGVMLQFSFNRRELVSPWLWSPEAETLRSRWERKKHQAQKQEAGTGGVQFIMPQRDVGVKAFVFELKDAGFVLTNAFSQVRASPRPETKGKNYYMVRFIFSAQPLREPIEPFFAKGLTERYEPALKALCSEPWRVRAYRNPRPEAPQLAAMSVNLESWAFKPVSAHPCSYLRLTNGRIELDRP